MKRKKITVYIDPALAGRIEHLGKLIEPAPRNRSHLFEILLDVGLEHVPLPPSARPEYKQDQPVPYSVVKQGEGND